MRHAGGSLLRIHHTKYNPHDDRAPVIYVPVVYDVPSNAICPSSLRHIYTNSFSTQPLLAVRCVLRFLRIRPCSSFHFRIDFSNCWVLQAVCRSPLTGDRPITGLPTQNTDIRKKGEHYAYTPYPEPFEVSFYTVLSSFLKIKLSITLPLTPSSSRWAFSCRFSDRIV